MDLDDKHALGDWRNKWWPQLIDMRFGKFSHRFHRRAWKHCYNECEVEPGEFDIRPCRGGIGIWVDGDRGRRTHEDGKDRREPYGRLCHGTCYEHSAGRCWSTFRRLFHTLACIRACKRFGREPPSLQCHLLQDSQSHLHRDWHRFLGNNWITFSQRTNKKSRDMIETRYLRRRPVGHREGSPS